MKNTFGPFSILGGFGTVAALCVVISVLYQMDVVSAVLFVTVGWLFYGKLVFAMSFTQGYGVKGTKTVAGMPVLIAMFIAAITSIIALVLKITDSSTGLLPETVANLRMVGWSAATGLATAIGYWYSHGRKEYFYESEYSIRVQCAERGDSPEAANRTVADFRSRGIIK